MHHPSAEHQRLHDDGHNWKRWGPYLSERAWGTVREDYSADGNAWNFFPHDHARSRVYRWNEDGLAGICDDRQWLCFALALWNGRDPILKERLFGLTGPEGNHGEDVKEYYFYLDSTPTHSWMRMVYKYPQQAFPYTDLIETNRRRSKQEPEYELIDTGIFAQNRYFDVFVEYAKAGPDDILIRVRAVNRGPDAAELHLLPTLWFRNNWSWGRIEEAELRKPVLQAGTAAAGPAVITASHVDLGDYVLVGEAPAGAPALLFTENETNTARLFGTANRTPYVKDGINDHVVNGKSGAVNPGRQGTKAALHYRFSIGAGQSAAIRLRLTKGTAAPDLSFQEFDALLTQRQMEADAFYAAVQPRNLNDDHRLIQRQALAGLLWSKQIYHYKVQEWLDGDPAQPPPPKGRDRGRNRDWQHLCAHDIISMPDKWEYPWFAAWDLAFHCIPLALVDLDFAKEQLRLLFQEWYQHPNGHVPSYEWTFDDTNPPVLAWAVWRIYLQEKQERGKGDRAFLKYLFHKLALHFTWWVNRKDTEGNNLFQGGFLGMDNIGVFDRNLTLPSGVVLEQCDGTSWMAMFCLLMGRLAHELADEDRLYVDIGLQYVYHFIQIVVAMWNIGGQEIALWDSQDAFFYDVVHTPQFGTIPLKLRSLVGLVPLLAVTTFDEPPARRFPHLSQRITWMLKQRPHVAQAIMQRQNVGFTDRRLMAVCRDEHLHAVLRRMLDPAEFLSPYGIRSLSRVYAEQPYHLQAPRQTFTVTYQPAESDSNMFGGNSNWRGPIWFPLNYLLIQSLREYHHYYRDDFKVACPTNSGNALTLDLVADDLSRRLIRIFERDEQGRRAVFGDCTYFQTDPHWRDCIPFYEYFHGDNGRGVGASHQTGWTALVASLIQEMADKLV